MSFPSINTFPEVGLSTPPIKCNSVDFPDPLAPTIATNSPFSTVNLDSKSSDEIVELLKKSNRDYKQTIIMITHNMEIAKIADRIIKIEDGKIVKEV